MDNQGRLITFWATGIYFSPEIQQRFGFSQPVTRLSKSFRLVCAENLAAVERLKMVPRLL